MKTYRDILQELFDTKIPIRVTADQSYMFSAFFDIPAEKPNIDRMDFKFQFMATKVGDDNPWEIIFVRSGDNIGDRSSIDVFNDMTTKEVLSTFSGVKAAMMKWIKSQNPYSFAFTAKSTEKSRVKLYKNFAKLIAKKLNLNMITGKVKSNDKFVFSKKGINNG